MFDPTFSKDWNIVEAWRMAVNEALEKGEPRPSKLKFSMTYKEGLLEEELEALEIETAIKNLRFQIVDTDYKIIENSDSIIVYHPRASISAGVICEMIYAKRLGKMVYAYYPYEPSLFFEWYATYIFKEEDALRDFLIKKSKESGQMTLDVF